MFTMHSRHTDGEALRRLIAERDLTHIALAKKAGVSYSHLKYVIAGERELSDRLAHRIARTLNVSVEEFTRPGRRPEAVA